jgi:hypothetical protein
MAWAETLQFVLSVLCVGGCGVNATACSTPCALTSFRVSASLRKRANKGVHPMKQIIVLAATGIVLSLTAITPANAQKNPACIEKCNRDNKVAGGGMQTRGTGQAIAACNARCPPAGKASGKGK